MCGIFAAVGRDLPESSLERVFATLRHRGPDGRGHYVDKAAKLTLAHTRLAVIDLVTGAQPIESADGNIVLVANGEIYDFERIRTSLESRGHHFTTKSDSELILHLYREFGLECFEHLRGEFAFVLYDKANRILVAARDRFGIKPLYLARLDGGFVFASEMKAILASGLIPPKLNIKAFDPLLDQNPADPQFPFEGMGHVPPASYFAIDLETGETRLTRYWSGEIPAASAEPVDEISEERSKAASQLVLQELEEAVRLRLRADVPLGLYLSGGIDSAFIGALMKRNLDRQLHSFSISFEGSGRNEQQLARSSAELIGTEHHEICVTKQMLWSNLEDCLWFSELPFVSLAPVGKFLLSAEARKRVTVVLTGEGADEVFLGYRTYFHKAIRDTRSRKAPGPGRSFQSRRLKIGSGAEKLSLLLFHKSRRRHLAHARAEKASAIQPSRPLINVVQEARLAAMPFDILSYLGDREEMAHSLEGRLPFLDHRLYEAAKEIPVDLKMRDGLEKAVLRDAAKGILPDQIRLRRKSGFMLTAEAVDLFGADRSASAQYRPYLRKEKFEEAGIFSYRAYLVASMLAKIPPRLRPFRRMRRNSNKLIMYMMQTHMLHDMFVVNPRWDRSSPIEAPGLMTIAREDALP